MRISLVPSRHYGQIFESVGVVDVTGPGVHNSNHDHQVLVHVSGMAQLEARAGVLALVSGEQRPHLGTVAVGSKVILVFPPHDLKMPSGAVVYTVEARDLADPILVPEERVPVTGRDVCVRCGRPVELVRASWTVDVGRRRDLQGHQLDWFHVDGDQVCAVGGGSRAEAPARCSRCRSGDVRTWQEAWLDRTRCGACGHERVFMIGD